MAQPTSYERAATFYTNKMVPFLTPRMIARNLFADVIRLPEGKTTMQFDKISQMKDAVISYTLPDETLKRDFIGMTSDTIKAPFIYNGFEIEQDRLKAYISEGKDLPGEGVKAMAKTIATADQNLLINSYTPDGTNVRFDGLYSKATTIDNTAYDFATPGNASKGAAELVGMLQNSNITDCNFNAIMPYAKFTALQNSWIVGSGTGIWEIDKFIKNINPLGTDAAPGRIFASKFTPAGKVILSPSDPAGEYISLIVGYDPQTVVGYNSVLTERLSPVYVTGFESVVPYIRYPECIGVMASTGG